MGVYRTALALVVGFCLVGFASATAHADQFFGRVYEEVNGTEGYQDGVDVPVQGVQVSIVDRTLAEEAMGFVVDAAMTDAGGTYSFPNVSLDERYEIRLLALQGHVGNVVLQTMNVAPPPAVQTPDRVQQIDDTQTPPQPIPGKDPAKPSSDPLTVSGASTGQHRIDFPLQRVELFYGRVYEEVNDIEGYQEGLDIPLHGVQVSLVDRTKTEGMQGFLVEGTLTDASGAYAFSGYALDGSYEIRLLALDGYVRPEDDQNMDGEPDDPALALVLPYRGYVVLQTMNVPPAPATKTPTRVKQIDDTKMPPEQIPGKNPFKPSSDPQTADPMTERHRTDFPVRKGNPEPGDTWISALAGVTGSVVDELTGVGLPGVTVRLTAEIDFDGNTASAVGSTDASGVFVFTNPRLQVLTDGIDKFEPIATLELDPAGGMAFGPPIELRTRLHTSETFVEYLLPELRVRPPTQLGSLAGVAFLEAPGGNGSRDPGEAPAEGASVRLEGATGAPVGMPVVVGADGAFAFGDLPEGNYRLVATLPGGESGAAVAYVPAGGASTQDVAIEFEAPCTGPDCPCTGPDCPCPNPDNPDCGPMPQPCAYDTCTDGLLHEVMLEADVWIGMQPQGFDVAARLLDGCSPFSRAVDRVEVSYQGTAWPYGGPVAGLDDVLAIHDVRMQPGSAWATVRLVMTADFGALPDGSFGRGGRRLELTVNGRRTLVCWRFTCPQTRAGGRVGTFRVLRTLGRDAWGTCTNTELPPVVDPGPIGGGKSHKSAKSAKSAKSDKSKKSKKRKKSRKPKHRKSRR